MSVAWSSIAWEMTSVTKRTTAASSSTISSVCCWRLGGDVALVAVLERARADAEILDDQLVDAFRHGEVPRERAVA
jgi:hypothetical protein